MNYICICRRILTSIQCYGFFSSKGKGRFCGRRVLSFIKVTVHFFPKIILNIKESISWIYLQKAICKVATHLII